MSKFTNYLFLLLTIINFLSILAIYYLYQTKINLPPNSGTAKSIKPAPGSPKANLIIIETKYGQLGGSKLSFEKKSVVSYLGIPYAQPPVGKLRHKAPLDALPWNGSLLQATSWPKPCLQPDNRLRLNNANFSEDCLYLNIWTPHQGGSQAPGKKPVIVVIHTGAFIFGSASEATYNGLVLAAVGDLVVVTFNYRLNYYGFFYTGKGGNEVVPNAGMLDQVAALKWIQANIGAFNGDPSRVTLVGQSSGALSVGLHITSPLSRHTFSQAIIMSGSPLQTPALNTPDHVGRFWLNYARQLNCLSPSDTVLSPAVHQCIDKILSVNRNLLPTMPQVKTLSADSLFVNLPIVIDDAFQPRSPVEALIADSGSQNVANISLLFGYTNDEGSWIAALENAEKFGPKVTPSLTQEEARELIEIYLGKMKTTKAEINSTDMIQYYLSEMYQLQGHSPKDDSLVLSRLVSSLLGDHYIACPANLFASLLQASNASRGSSLYQYYWTYKGSPRSSPFWSTFSNVWCGQWMGSCHSFEMFALFGIPFLEPSAFNADDRIVSMKTIQMVTYFANNGKLFWPKFADDSSEGSQKVYYIMDNSVEQYNFGTDLKADVCDNIWKEYLL